MSRSVATEASNLILATEVTDALDLLMMVNKGLLLSLAQP